MKRNNLDKVCALLGGLSPNELVELQDIISGLLSAINAENNAPHVTETPNGDPDVPQIGTSGHLERKLINGYGPYLYLRRWVNGHLTSTYVGKANPDKSD